MGNRKNLNSRVNKGLKLVQRYVYISINKHVVRLFGIAVKSSVDHAKSLSLIPHCNTLNTHLLQKGGMVVVYHLQDDTEDTPPPPPPPPSEAATTATNSQTNNKQTLYQLPI